MIPPSSVTRRAARGKRLTTRPAPRRFGGGRGSEKSLAFAGGSGVLWGVDDTSRAGRTSHETCGAKRRGRLRRAGAGRAGAGGRQGSGPARGRPGRRLPEG